MDAPPAGTYEECALHLHILHLVSLLLLKMVFLDDQTKGFFRTRHDSMALSCNNFNEFKGLKTKRTRSSMWCIYRCWKDPDKSQNTNKQERARANGKWKHRWRHLIVTVSCYCCSPTISSDGIETLLREDKNIIFLEWKKTPQTGMSNPNSRRLIFF